MRSATASDPPSAEGVWAAVRSEFPILSREVGGRPLAYLDSAATSLKPASVIRALADHYQSHDGSPHSGLHTLAAESTEALDAARGRIATWVGAPSPEGVVLTRNTTAALNLVARGLEARLGPGDEVLLTEMEHHANLVPWIQLARRRGVVLRHVPLRSDRLDVDAIARLVTERTRVVSLCHVSNVIGAVNPIAEVVSAARRVDALVVLDAAQSVGHMPVRFDELGVDLLAFSAHKTYGPAGLGVLVGTARALEGLEPLEGGGQMIDEVELDRATWAPIPQRFEAGTLDVAAASAFVPAIDLIEGLGLAAIRAHEMRLVGLAWEGLARLGGIRLMGPDDPAERGSLVSFHDPCVHPHDLATLLDGEGVAVRAGHHCAQPLHRRLGLAATVRASFGVYSTEQDVERLVEAVGHARTLFS